MRYYNFDEDRVITIAGAFADLPHFDELGTTSSDGVSPRVILAFSPSKNAQFTAQVARGFRLGGINDPLNATLCQGNDLDVYGGHPTWDDEKVTNFEIGAKTRFADGRVTLNGAVFMSKIDGLQVVADAGSCSSRIILNADAESKGAEVELFVRPDEHWDLGLSATYADAEITESQLDDTGHPISGIREGNRLPTSPKLQAVGNARVQLHADRLARQLRAADRAARRLVVHAARGPGAELRADHERDAPARCRVADQFRRSAGEHEHRVRSRAAVV